MADRFSKAKEFAADKLAEVSSALGTQREIRALRKEITDLVGARDRLMAEMGRKVFALHGRGKVRNADLLGDCEQVERINREIDRLNVKIQELARPQPQGEAEPTELTDETELDEAEAEEESEALKEEESPETEAAEEDEAEEDARERAEADADTGEETGEPAEEDEGS